MDWAVGGTGGVTPCQGFKQTLFDGFLMVDERTHGLGYSGYGRRHAVSGVQACIFKSLLLFVDEWTHVLGCRSCGRRRGVFWV